MIGDIPENSHFDANIITSFMTNPRSGAPDWLSNSFSTCLLLNPNTSPEDVDRKITDLLVKYVGPELQRYMGISIEEFGAQGNK
ncbi:MAG: hypothetical protein P1P83_11570 [Bacteroidales bacterium]|nr:hypothetical protein [Bacteroidales bacterium]MDT8374850.1 hypothetical protein [Bacteroidales bacterium]